MRSFCHFFFLLIPLWKLACILPAATRRCFRNIEGERWKSCCECKRGDAKIGKNVSAFRWNVEIVGIAGNVIEILLPIFVGDVAACYGQM